MSTTQTPTVTTPGRRDAAIDATRGLCIISMIAAHLSKGSVFDAVAHPIPYVDGALGFVLLSGLLIGIVQRSTMARAGEGAGYRKLLRRARLVYLGHLLLCVVAIVIGTVDASRWGELPSRAGEGGWLSAVWRVLTLQINPAYASVLSLYVVVMLGALPLLWLLRRGRPVVAVAMAGLVYAAGVAVPGWSQLPQRGGEVGGWSYATWFGLFAVGVIAGRYWRLEPVQRFVTSRTALVGGTVVAVAGVAAAVLLPNDGPAVRLLDKEALGPVRLAVGVAVYFALWRALTAIDAHRVGARVLAPFTLLGQRSLDSYLILSVMVITVPSIGRLEQATATGMVAAVACVAACFGWAAVRRSRSGVRARTS